MRKTRAHESVNRKYDLVMYHEFEQGMLERDGFTNYGYWEPSTTCIREAHTNLMHELADRIHRNKSLLDVACGKGATSKFLSNYVPAELITGINISERQIASCKEMVPEAEFLLMDAVCLEFGDASFDNVVCVEAAFHFNTRRRFLEESYRVLKPHGRLVTADILITMGEGYYSEGDEEDHWWFPRENSEISTVDEYSEALRKIGYRDIEIVDVTVQCTDRFIEHARRYVTKKWREKAIDDEEHEGRMEMLELLRKVSRPYVLTSAER